MYFLHSSFKVMPSESALHWVSLVWKTGSCLSCSPELKITTCRTSFQNHSSEKSLLNIAIAFHIHFISPGTCRKPEAETETQITVNHLYYLQTVSKLNPNQNNSEIDFVIYFIDQSLQRNGALDH